MRQANAETSFLTYGSKIQTMAATRTTNAKTNGRGSLGFEEQLWQTADQLRGNMDAAVYKHVVLGLIFLKYISDAFEQRREEIEADVPELVEVRDEYQGFGVFWVPQPARWDHIQARTRQPNIGQTIDEAMDAIERENPSLKGVLPKEYAKPDLDAGRLGNVIDLITNIDLRESQSKGEDVLGRVYEYFLAKFAAAEGKNGGQFYTPRHVVKLLVEMVKPLRGRIYDPCCGSGGMFVQSERFVEVHGGHRTDIRVFGQESNATTWRLARMNLALRGIEADLGARARDSFLHDLHPDLKADHILANPPFNDKAWGREQVLDDPRWKYGLPPANNANYAWIQHFVHHLGHNGVAGFVMANGALSSNTDGQGEIRKALVEADLVDGIVSLPGQLFYSTQIPVTLWFLAKNKNSTSWRDRRGEMLFIDAREMGAMTDRTHRELTDEDIRTIADTYHAWRGEPDAGEYEDYAGFCASVAHNDIRAHDFALAPGRYVSAASLQHDGESTEAKITELTEQLLEDLEQSDALTERLRAVLLAI